MTHKHSTPDARQRDVDYYREQIAMLSQPKTNRERMLLEIYEQLVEKHSRTAPQEPR
jgi:hypothetical protein